MKLRIAISGVYRSGETRAAAGIIRGIRRQFPNAEICGILYTALETGRGVVDGVDEIYSMPHPAVDDAGFLERLDVVRTLAQFDFFVPTLPGEIEALSKLQDEFALRGISIAVPDPESSLWSSRAALRSLGAACGLPVVKACDARDVESALRAADTLEYPVSLRNETGEAATAHSQAELTRNVSHMLLNGSNAFTVTKLQTGSSYSVTGIGDGRGGIYGQCGIRKSMNRNGEANCTDPEDNAERALSELCNRMIGLLQWRGPFEMQFACEGGVYALAKFNAHFPSWVDLSPADGPNLPAALIGLLRTIRKEAPLQRIAALTCEPSYELDVEPLQEAAAG